MLKGDDTHNFRGENKIARNLNIFAVGYVVNDEVGLQISKHLDVPFRSYGGFCSSTLMLKNVRVRFEEVVLKRSVNKMGKML